MLLCLTLAGLLFINVSNVHDWGDDYAQYLDQTKDLLNGTPSGPPEVLGSEHHAPEIRGTGFSLLLSLPMALSEDAIRPFLLFNSFILFLCGFSFYYYLRESINPWLATLIVLAFCYNFQIIRFKAEIMPEFSFIFILFSILLINRQRDKTHRSHSVFLAILLGLLISIKIIGVLMLAAVLITRIRANHPNYLELLWISIISVGTFFLIQFIVVHALSLENLTWYFQLEKTPNESASVTYYGRIFLEFFEQEIWAWANWLVKTLVILLTLVGVLEFRHSAKSLEFHFILLYLSVIILYPDINSGSRFLIPILPLLLYIIATGSIVVARAIFSPRFSHFVLIVSWALLLSSNYLNIRNLVQLYPNSVQGPFNAAGQELVIAIDENLRDDTVVVTNKPWAIHYLIEVPCMNYEAWSETDPSEGKERTYLFVETDSPQQAIQEWNSKVIWKNSEYAISSIP